MGRFNFYFEIVSPEKSFNTKSTISRYNTEVNSVLKEKANAEGFAQMTQTEFDEFRYKRLIVASSTSPDSGEVIPWAMRTCSFVPTNIPIILGMLVSPPTMMYTIFWQVTNQTYNAGLNFGNRNASSKQTTNELF